LVGPGDLGVGLWSFEFTGNAGVFVVAAVAALVLHADITSVRT
jgi:hypothetical protein